MSGNPAPAAPSSNEVKLWEGSSSQWIHFWFNLMCAVIAIVIVATAFYTRIWWISAGVVVPVVMWFARWLVTRTTVYTLTNERLLIRRGILDRHQDNLELYRVRDYAICQPLLLRMIGLGSLNLITSDTLTPNVAIHAIGDVEGVREKLRQAVEAARDRKRVRQMDLDSLDGGGPVDGGDIHHT